LRQRYHIKYNNMRGLGNGCTNSELLWQDLKKCISDYIRRSVLSIERRQMDACKIKIQRICRNIEVERKNEQRKRAKPQLYWISETALRT